MPGPAGGFLRASLVLLLAAQAGGILLADRGLLGGQGALALGATSLGLGLAFPALRLVAGCALALAAGAGSLGGLLEDAARAERRGERDCILEGTVASVERYRHGWRVGLEQVTAVEATDPPLPRRLQLSGRATPVGIPAFEAARVGDRVRAAVRLRTASGLRNPGGRDTTAGLRRAGIGLVGGLTHPALHVRVGSAPGLHVGRAVHALRLKLSDRLGRSGPGGGLLAALALGDRHWLAPRWRDAFGRLGVAHLLAVSGLHLALVAALAYAVLRAVLARCGLLRLRPDVRPAALAGACAAAFAYALLAGWGVPVRRALVLLLALGIGFAWRRPTARLAPLGAAGIWILAVEPGALFAPGAQLSFAASAALLLAARAPGTPSGSRSGTVGGFLSGTVAGFLSGTLRTTATAIAVTAPLAALQLGSRAPLALAANLVLVPWTALVLLPAALASAAAAALGGATGQALLGLAERTAWATLATLAVAAEKLPGATGAPPPAGAWLLVAALFGVLALRARSLGGRVGWAAAVSVWLAAAPPAVHAPPPPRVVFLDVGQGDAALVQGRAAAVLIDAGSALPEGPDLGRLAVVPALRALGVTRLDLAVASHADLDHRGGLSAVLAALPVGALWLPRGGRADPDFAGLLATAAGRGVPVFERGRGDPPSEFGDLRVVPLWPPARGAGTRNDRSLVLRVEAAGRRVLFAGDLEAAGENALVATGTDLASDVLKLGHHGSRSSSTQALLDAVRPALAVVSAPCRGRFAWPHPGVVARLRGGGARLRWTGRDGAVWIGLGPSLRVRGTGVARRCPLARR